MKVDEVLADEWYKEISDFLEARVQHKDTEAPGSRISALCRVLADAVENADGTREQKLEAIVRLTAMALGLEQKFMIIRDPTGSSADTRLVMCPSFFRGTPPWIFSNFWTS